MSSNPELSKYIEAKIHEAASKSGEERLLAEVAGKTGALPLFLDAGGGYALLPTGDVIAFSWDHLPDWQIEKDLRTRNIVLFQGSKQYPELKALVPEKPSSARQCPYCNGSGIHPAALELDRKNIICYCGGLGWLPQ